MNLAEFSERCEEFIVYMDVEKGVSNNTLKSYQLDLKQFSTFWKHLQKTSKKKQLFKTVLDRFFVHFYTQNISKSSIARKISCLNSFEKFLLTQGIDLKLSLQRPKIDRKLPVFLSVDEIFHLLDKVKTKDLPSQHPERDKTILEFLYATGIRCSELINIGMEDLDFDEKTILIKGKGSKERIVLFGEKAKQQAMIYLKDERIKPQSPQEKFFLNNRGSYFPTNMFQK